MSEDNLQVSNSLGSLISSSRLEWGRSTCFGNGGIGLTCDWLDGRWLVTIRAGVPAPDNVEGHVFELNGLTKGTRKLFSTDRRGQFFAEGLPADTYSLRYLGPAGQVGPTRGSAREGLTPRVHDPRLFDELMQEVAPLLLERVSIGRSFVRAFMLFIHRPGVWMELRQAMHVRDVVGKVLADFCRESALCPDPNPEALLERNVIENVLWQVSTAILRKGLLTGEDRVALDRLDNRLRESLRTSPVEEPELVAATSFEGSNKLAEELRTAVKELW